MSRSELKLKQDGKEAKREAAAKLAAQTERVRFLHRYKMYNVGETAGFPAPFAKRLADAGLAEIVQVPKSRKK